MDTPSCCSALILHTPSCSRTFYIGVFYLRRQVSHTQVEMYCLSCDTPGSSFLACCDRPPSSSMTAIAHGCQIPEQRSWGTRWYRVRGTDGAGTKGSPGATVAPSHRHSHLCLQPNNHSHTLITQPHQGTPIIRGPDKILLL